MHVLCSCLSFPLRRISGSLGFSHGLGGPAVLPWLRPGPPAAHFHSISLPALSRLSLSPLLPCVFRLAGPRACPLILLPWLREVATWSVTCSPGDRAPVTVAHHTHWPNESCGPPAIWVLTGRGTRFPPSSLIQDYVTLRREAKDIRKPQRRPEGGGGAQWGGFSIHKNKRLILGSPELPQDPEEEGDGRG